MVAGAPGPGSGPDRAAARVGRADRERLDFFLDRGSFIELDAIVTQPHRAGGFGRGGVARRTAPGFGQDMLASGVVRQLSAIMGPGAGDALNLPAMTGFTIMVDGTSYLYVTGPKASGP